MCCGIGWRTTGSGEGGSPSIPSGAKAPIFLSGVYVRAKARTLQSRHLVMVASLTIFTMTTKKRHKGTPTGETGQEALYLKSLSERQVQVAIKMRDGETVTGWIEYFDDMMVRLTREGKPNLFIYKTQIRTITEGSVAGSKRSVHNDESAG